MRRPKSRSSAKRAIPEQATEPSAGHGGLFTATGTYAGIFHPEIFQQKAAGVFGRNGNRELRGHIEIGHPAAAAAMHMIMPAHIIIIADVRPRHSQFQSLSRLRKPAQDAKDRSAADRRIPPVHIAVYFRGRRMIQRFQRVVNDPLLLRLSFLQRISLLIEI